MGKLFFHRFQNITQLFGPKKEFGHFWGGEGGRVCMSLTWTGPYFLSVHLSNTSQVAIGRGTWHLLTPWRLPFDPSPEFPFHILPSPVHPTGFFLFLPWLPCHFYLVIEQQQQRHVHPTWIFGWSLQELINMMHWYYQNSALYVKCNKFRYYVYGCTLILPV